MGFFDELTAKLSVAGQEAAKKAKELADVGRTNLKIGDEERKLSGMFEYLGSSLYKAHLRGETEDYTEAFGEIAEQEKKIAELRLQLSKLKNQKTCPKCGADTAFDDKYCPKCGRSFGSEEGKDEFLPEYCPNCGARVAKGAKNCANCNKVF